MSFASTYPESLPRVALVTGGAKRIGRVLCEHLAQAGFAVAIHYHQSKDEAEALCAELTEQGFQAACFAADLREPAQLDGLVARVAQRLGTVGVLINNASLFVFDAIAPDAAPDAGHGGNNSKLGDEGAGHAALDVQIFEAHWRTNTFAPLLLTQQLAQGLPTGAQGVVINMLDQKLHNPNPDFLSYTLSKAALAEATRLCALALAPQVRVVGIAPGLTLPSYAHNDSQVAALHQLSLLGRSSTPQDIARTALFILASPAMTGTTILVDGGQHLMRFERDFSLMNPTEG